MPSRIAKLEAAMAQNPAGVRFSDALRLASFYFGEPRVTGSHHIFRTPWPGLPRVNLQQEKGNTANQYQIRQLLDAIEKAKSISAQGKSP